MLQPFSTSHAPRPRRSTGRASSCHVRITNPTDALPPNSHELDMNDRIGLAGRPETDLPTCAMWDRFPVGAEDQDPNQGRTNTASCLVLPAVSAGQKRWTPCTTNRRRTYWHPAQAAEWDRSAPRNSRRLATPTQSRGRLTSEATRLMTHQNERQMSVKMPRRASSQRQDIARNAHTAHNAHHPNPQVRRPSRWARGSPRTPRGASSGRGRRLGVCGACSRTRGSRRGRGPGPPGRRPRRRCGGRPCPPGV
jgi:hypothetical protein